MQGVLFLGGEKTGDIMDPFREFMERNDFDDEEYKKTYLKVKQMKYQPLMDAMFRFNGKPYENFYEFMDKKMKALEIVFSAPKKWGEWHFNDPVKELRILPNGIGAIRVMDGEINPQRWLLENPPFQKVMVRLIVERSHPSGTYGLLTPEKFFQLINEGVVPYVARILAYSKERRYKVDLNIVNSEVIADFRWGKIPPRIFRRRDVKEYFIFDKIYSTLPVAHFPKMFFEALFESDGLDTEILSLIFNVNPSMVENNVGVLIKHNVVKFSEEKGIYSVTLPMPSQ